MRAHRDGAQLRLEVQDNGPGLQTNKQELIKGIGLSNTEARLTQLYGSSFRFEIGNHPEGGVLVTIVLPFRTREEGA